MAGCPDVLLKVPLLLQVTLLREHCQGPNAMLYTLPTGGYDPRKSSSFLAAAQAELSEEVQVLAWLLPAKLHPCEAHAHGCQAAGCCEHICTCMHLYRKPADVASRNPRMQSPESPVTSRLQAYPSMNRGGNHQMRSQWHSS